MFCEMKSCQSAREKGSTINTVVSFISEKYCQWSIPTQTVQEVENKETKHRHGKIGKETLLKK